MPKPASLITLGVSIAPQDLRPENPLLCTDDQFETYIDAVNYTVAHLQDEELPTPLHESIRVVILDYLGPLGKTSYSQMIVELRNIAESVADLTQLPLEGSMSHVWNPEVHGWHPWMEEFEAFCNPASDEALTDFTETLGIVISAPTRARMDALLRWGNDVRNQAQLDLNVLQAQKDDPSDEDHAKIAFRTPVTQVMLHHFPPQVTFDASGVYNEKDAYRIIVKEQKDTRNLIITVEWSFNNGKLCNEFGIPHRIAESRRLDEMVKVDIEDDEDRDEVISHLAETLPPVVYTFQLNPARVAA